MHPATASDVRSEGQAVANVMLRAEAGALVSQGGLRLIDIDGVDLNPCGGTHLASLAELQACILDL